jgi:molybdopterin-guanine dinucleotide biosynthesis protein MobB
MTKAGAVTVVVSSENKLAMIKAANNESSLFSLIDWLFKDVDIVITEGYKLCSNPKILVIGASENKPLILDNIFAIVNNTGEDFKKPLPVKYEKVHKYNMNDINKLIDYIEENFLLCIN